MHIKQFTTETYLHKKRLKHSTIKKRAMGKGKTRNQLYFNSHRLSLPNAFTNNIYHGRQLLIVSFEIHIVYLRKSLIHIRTVAKNSKNCCVFFSTFFVHLRAKYGETFYLLIFFTYCRYCRSANYL